MRHTCQTVLPKDRSYRHTVSLVPDFTTVEIDVTRLCYGIIWVMVRSSAISLQAWAGPQGSRSLRLPEFLDNPHMKVVCLSALGTGRLYPPGDIPDTHFS